MPDDCVRARLRACVCACLQWQRHGVHLAMAVGQTRNAEPLPRNHWVSVLCPLEPQAISQSRAEQARPSITPASTGKYGWLVGWLVGWLMLTDGKAVPCDPVVMLSGFEPRRLAVAMQSQAMQSQAIQSQAMLSVRDRAQH